MGMKLPCLDALRQGSKSAIYGGKRLLVEAGSGNLNLARCSMVRSLHASSAPPCVKLPRRSEQSSSLRQIRWVIGTSARSASRSIRASTTSSPVAGCADRCRRRDWRCGAVLDRDEDNAPDGAGSLPDQHHARQPDPLPDAHAIEVSGVAPAERAGAATCSARSRCGPEPLIAHRPRPAGQGRAPAAAAAYPPPRLGRPAAAEEGCHSRSLCSRTSRLGDRGPSPRGRLPRLGPRWSCARRRPDGHLVHLGVGRALAGSSRLGHTLSVLG